MRSLARRFLGLPWIQPLIKSGVKYGDANWAMLVAPWGMTG